MTDRFSPPDLDSKHSLQRPLIRIVLWVTLAVVSLAYLLQLPTPLRMNTDAISYLSMAAAFNDGHGFIWHGHKPHFPPGYPAVVALLERAGAACSAGLVAWNLLMLALTTASGAWLLRRWLRFPPLVVLLLSVLFLLSCGIIRYALIPGSEPTYMAVSLFCLVSLLAAESPDTPRKKQWIFWLVGLALTSAILIRSVGVTLIPAVLWSLLSILWQRRKFQGSLRQWIILHRRNVIGFAIVGFVAAALLAWRLTSIAYFREGLSLMRQNGWRAEATFAIKERCIEAGSLLLNVPRTINARTLHDLTLAGIPCLLILLWLLVRRWRTITCVEVYLAAYLAVLLVWPYKADVRFWIPIELPLFGLLAREILNLASRAKIAMPVKIVAAGWIAIFVISGVMAFVRTTQLTYAGKQFGDRYDLIFMRDAYRVAPQAGVTGAIVKSSG